VALRESPTIEPAFYPKKQERPAVPGSSVRDSLIRSPRPEISREKPKSSIQTIHETWSNPEFGEEAEELRNERLILGFKVLSRCIKYKTDEQVEPSSADLAQLEATLKWVQGERQFGKLRDQENELEPQIFALLDHFDDLHPAFKLRLNQSLVQETLSSRQYHIIHLMR